MEMVEGLLEDIIKKKLDEMKFPYRQTGAEYITTNCLNPAHDDKSPSFAINTTTGGGRCFSCKFPVNAQFWLGGLMDEETLDEFMRSAKYSKLRVDNNKESKIAPPLQVPRDSEQPIPSDWRGLSDEWVAEFRLYHCEVGKYKNRYIFPMLDAKENMFAYNSRDLDPTNKTNKYMYSFGLNTKEALYPEWLLAVHRPTDLLIVEGFMDCISAWQLGLPALANFGANVSFDMEKIGKLVGYGIDRIILVLDEDEAGEKVKQEYLESKLPDYFEVILGRNFKPLADFYASGLKDLSDYLETKVSGEEG